MNQQSLKLAENTDVNNDIIIITIDDFSLEQMQGYAGRWPWPRSVHAELVEVLAANNVSAIAFDILFNESDIYRPDDDAYFEETLLATEQVYLATLGLLVNHQASRFVYARSCVPFFWYTTKLAFRQRKCAHRARCKSTSLL